MTNLQAIADRVVARGLDPARGRHGVRSCVHVGAHTRARRQSAPVTERVYEVNYLDSTRLAGAARQAAGNAR